VSALDALAVFVLFAVALSILLTSFAAVALHRSELDAAYVYWPSMARGVAEGRPSVPYAELLSCWLDGAAVAGGSAAPYGLAWRFAVGGKTLYCR